MAEFYEIRLRRFRNDIGRTGSNRELSFVQEAREAGQDIELANEVKFVVTPNVTESRSAQYVNEGLPENAGIVVYAVTENRRFSISGKFLSRNIVEAENNYRQLSTLKSWMIPRNIGNDRARPPVLRLYGYKKQFQAIPVVVSDLNITYPEDVDYIETGLAMVPILQSVELTLVESHPTRVRTGGSVEEFDLNRFRQGILEGF